VAICICFFIRPLLLATATANCTDLFRYIVMDIFYRLGANLIGALILQVILTWVALLKCFQTVGSIPKLCDFVFYFYLIVTTLYLLIFEFMSYYNPSTHAKGVTDNSFFLFAVSAFIGVAGLFYGFKLNYIIRHSNAKDDIIKKSTTYVYFALLEGLICFILLAISVFLSQKPPFVNYILAYFVFVSCMTLITYQSFGSKKIYKSIQRVNSGTSNSEGGQNL